MPPIIVLCQASTVNMFFNILKKSFFFFFLKFFASAQNHTCQHNMTHAMSLAECMRNDTDTQVLNCGTGSVIFLLRETSKLPISREN